MSSPPRDTHRTKLIEAACKLLREREYGNITARDLVAASGTNLGSIGYHFGSKEALLNEAIGVALEQWAERIGETIRGDGAGGLPVLMGSLGLVLDSHAEARPYYRAFIAALARSEHSPELRAQLVAHYRRQRERIAGWVRDAVSDALEPAEARHIASLMLATADGMLVQSFVDPSAVPSSSELGGAMAKAFARAAQPVR